MIRRALRSAAILLIVSACSREAPAPDAKTSSPAPTASPAAPVAATKTGGTYDGAMTWLRSTPGFRFVLDEGGIHAEGVMRRPTVGAEIVEFRANGAEWRGAPTAEGLTWEQKQGDQWARAEPPPFANRLYQRVAIAFDPQKKEGAAQLIEHGSHSNHYRFTNANTGEVHDVHVSRVDDHVERITIGSAMDLQLTPLEDTTFSS